MSFHRLVALSYGLTLPLVACIFAGCAQSAPSSGADTAKAGASGQTNAAGAASSGGAPAGSGAMPDGSAGSTNGGVSSGGTPSGGASAGGVASGGTDAAGGPAGTGGATVAAGGAVSGAGSSGGSSLACPMLDDFASWPNGKGPLDLGKLAVTDFKTHIGEAYGYPLALAWASALRFTHTSGDSTNDAALISAFDSSSIKSNPPPNPVGKAYVDDRVFGVLPLEIYLQDQDASDKMLGLERADNQWLTLNADNITADARDWSDDMFMITGLQVMAYRANDQGPYLDHATKAMLLYLGKLRENGLFWHTTVSRPAWGRANGWFASGMTELLLELPQGLVRAAILDAYQQHMAALLPLQISGGSDDGCWRQVLDLPSAPAETSCTAMFTTALATGMKNGWLTDPKYAAAARKGWQCVADKTDPTSGKVDRACPGTGEAPQGTLATQQQFYVDRMTQVQTGDLHGQLALLWAANALIRTDCPGLR